MSLVFVVQTFPDERRPMSEFLEASGYEVGRFATTKDDLHRFRRSLVGVREPLAVITSQRDTWGSDEIANRVHADVVGLKVPTLTIVYARAVGDPVFANLQAKMQAVGAHGIVFIPKSSFANNPDDERTRQERQAVKQNVDTFFQCLEPSGS